MEMIAEGYRLNGYDAKYEKTTYHVRIRYEDDKVVIHEVTEANSGITFIYEERREKKHVRKKVRVNNRL